MIQIFFNSIISALMLALLALGFNLIFNATRVFHLTHGAIYVLGVFLVYTVQPTFGNWFAIPIAIVISINVALLVEYWVYRPLAQRHASAAISLISSLGVYTFLINLLAFFFGNEGVALDNSTQTFIYENAYFHINGIEAKQLLVGGLCFVGLTFFTKTQWYRNIRAISDSYEVSEKFGISVQQTRYIAMAVGSFLAIVSGLLNGFYTSTNPHDGLAITLMATVAVIVGGVRSLSGTTLACFVIALIDNFSVKILSQRWREVVIYALLIFVLLFFKEGLFSSKNRIEEQ
ncbi:branched-chain amino acid ABC transporter permease [Emticicia sp. W12TSBA100-4]|uniref:branched-chain amino acid ABC transporter permease n=1 Tax=Emticicia sp. W12TSBA100-4 TaxID=3160965 RepID=UPI003305DE6E